MATVATGSRLVMHAPRHDVVLRTLRSADFSGGWQVPVMVDWAVLESAAAGDEVHAVEVPTSYGVLHTEGRLEHGPGLLLLRAAALRPAALQPLTDEQRREDVRAEVTMPLRGAVLSGRTVEGEELDASLAGRTSTVSGGGLSVELASGPPPAPGSRVYLELEVPGGELAPAVVDVVQAHGSSLRGRFVDISERDRERLVRLVFERQRRELAERRRLMLEDGDAPSG